MASTEQLTATINAHVAAVGSADVDALALLYAEEADLQDPAGTTVAVGRSAIRRHFANVLTQSREVEIVFIAVTDHHAAFHFRATPAGGTTRDVIDTMTFDDHGAIVSMKAYASNGGE